MPSGTLYWTGSSRILSPSSIATSVPSSLPPQTTLTSINPSPGYFAGGPIPHPEILAATARVSTSSYGPLVDVDTSQAKSYKK